MSTKLISGNSTSPNFDNVGNLYLLRGKFFFSSFKIEYISKHIILLSEPYIMNKENDKMPMYSRGGRYVYTNELSNQINSPHYTQGLRESLFFIHYNFVGFGISNMNQWLGPGIHNTLTMTNNAKGFPHLFLATLNNKRINDFLSFNVRYTFSKLNNREGGVFFTSLAGLIQIDSDVIYRFGLIRDFLSGGKLSNNGEKILDQDAMQLVFGPLFSDSKKQIKYTSNWGFEPWDQQLAGFFEIIPDDETRIYIEIGTGDHRKNLTDLKANWDHNLAYVLGFKKQLQLSSKYRILLFGAEYTTLTGNSNTRKFRGSGPWYDNSWYDYSSYDGRRWAAHSGSDSDDFMVFSGINYKNKSLILYYSKERKGLHLEKYPELKYELLFNYNQKINSNLYFKIFLENEFHQNYFFIKDKKRNDISISFNLEYFFN